MNSMLAPELIVITGPMCSGKTEELIRYLRQSEHAKLGMLVVKPSVDTRDGQVLAIKSRNGHKLVAIDVPNAVAILEQVATEHVWIGIDEAHFFDIGLVAVVMQLVRSGKRVIVSGLDLDYLEKPFEVMAQLMALAQEVQKLTAVCSKCRVRHASRSQRLTDDTSRIAVGDKEYEPRCLQCYVPPNGVSHSHESPSGEHLSS